MFRAFVLAGVLAVAACTQQVAGPTPSTPLRDDVVNVTGHGGLRFGANRGDLAPFIDEELQGCNVQLAGRPEGSLVFGPDGKLVLLWFEAPLRTPEGLSTGDTLAEATAAYPEGAELPAPPGSHRFDGLLVAAGEHGYLFLHDGKTVRKAIAGYVEYLRRLFDSGFGVC